MITKGQIDSTQLKDAAKTVLENYQLNLKLKKRNETQISAVEYSGLPKGTMKGNPAENNILQHVNSEQYCVEVEKAIDDLSNDKQLFDVLTYTYIHPEDTVIKISGKMNISRSQYYNLLGKAQKEFGLLCKLVTIYPD